MKNFKYFTLAILSVFFISETLQAAPPGRRVPSKISKKTSSRAVEPNRPPAAPARATDSVRDSLPDISQNLKTPFLTLITRTQLDDVLQYMRSQGITEEQITEAIRRGYRYTVEDMNNHSLFSSFLRIQSVSAIADISTDHINNPLLLELMKRSLRWAIDENITQDDIKNEIHEVVVDLAKQGMTVDQISSMLVKTESFYDFTISFIDLTQETPAASLQEGLKPEDIRVARLIREALRVDYTASESFQFADLNPYELNPYEVDALFNYLKNERNMTETQIREIMAAGNKALEEDQRPLTGRYQGIPSHLKVPSTMQTENAINYLLNEAGMTRDEIKEVIVGNLQESSGNNPNQEAAH